MTQTRIGWPTELEDLYRERRVGFVRLAYLMIGDQRIAEELVQDAFVAAEPKWPEIDHPAAYIRTAVVNRCRSWARREHLARKQPVDAPESIEIEPDEMWDALQHLDEKYRAAIVLRFYEDLPDDEIADALDCAQATVRSLVKRGLDQLRLEIEP